MYYDHHQQLTTVTANSEDIVCSAITHVQAYIRYKSQQLRRHKKFIPDTHLQSHTHC